MPVQGISMWNSHGTEGVYNNPGSVGRLGSPSRDPVFTLLWSAVVFCRKRGFWRLAEQPFPESSREVQFLGIQVGLGIGIIQLPCGRFVDLIQRALLFHCPKRTEARVFSGCWVNGSSPPGCATSQVPYATIPNVLLRPLEFQSVAVECHFNGTQASDTPPVILGRRGIVVPMRSLWNWPGRVVFTTNAGGAGGGRHCMQWRVHGLGSKGQPVLCVNCQGLLAGSLTLRRLVHLLQHIRCWSRRTIWLSSAI